MSVSVASSLSALSLRRPGEPRRVAQRVRDVLPVLRERLGEALDVLDRARDPLRLDRAHELLDVVGERLELCRERPDALRRLSDLLEEAVDAGRVVAQRQREALDIGEGAVERAFVVGDDLADALEHVVGPARDRARRLHEVLEVGPIGKNRRKLLPGRRRERRRAGVAADERHRRDPGEALELELRPGVGADRRRAVDLDLGDDPARVLEVELRHLALADAVEGHDRALRQSRDRAGEHDPDRLPAGAGVAAGEPIDEQEGGRDDGEREDADQGVVGAGFHRRRPLRPRSPSRRGPACRGNKL